jgi:hypothetical protein
MDYPITGQISIGAYHVSDEDDLIDFYEYLQKTHGQEFADELAEKHPDIFVKTYSLTLTQKELDVLHLVIGHCISEETANIQEMIEPYVSPESLDDYDRVGYNLDSVDGLCIRIN